MPMGVPKAHRVLPCRPNLQSAGAGIQSSRGLSYYRGNGSCDV